MKKTLHVISHAHWDREWYMPFEHHRYRLVELIDNVIDLLENDPDFKYYHMDGQVIPIYDYLKVKPEMKERLLRLIREDRLQIGPWYVLQDEFLTSGEANIRNLMLGMKHAKKLGAKPLLIGYFPDSFGNISQAPQILKKAGIDFAAFGRGLNEVGFDNQVIKQDGLNKSELIWRSPDGSEVIGILFANWYCNANDLDTGTDKIKDRFEKIIENTNKFSLTNDLLGMNGCDHTPVQREIGKIVKTANQMFPEYKIIHSNFKKYMEAIKPYKDQFQVFEGEINGQLTTGYNLLINTASTRVDIKKINYQVQNILEHEAEPINALANLLKLPYDTNYLEHAWIQLIENHPHDSICSCNCDEVNMHVKASLLEAFHSATIIRDEAVRRVVESQVILGQDNQKQVVVFNKASSKLDHVVKAIVNFPTNLNVQGVKVTTLDGKALKATYQIKRNVFTYHLPKDRFRKVDYFDQVELEFLAKDLPGLGYNSYLVIPTTASDHKKEVASKILENSEIKLKFNQNGTFNLIHKKTKKELTNLNLYEYQANVGNEYNFTQSQDQVVITNQKIKAKFHKAIKTPLYEELSYQFELLVPVGVENQKTVAKQVKTEFETKVRLSKFGSGIKITTTIKNEAKNARYRAIFNPQIKSTAAYSEGQFDLVKRPHQKWEGWLNPVKTDRFHHFVMQKDQTMGSVISGHGLCEYEIINDNTFALTLLNGSGELGDWGVFPTPNSQMIGTYTLNYYFDYYQLVREDEKLKAAYLFHYDDFVTKDLYQMGSQLLRPNLKVAEVDNPKIIISAFKKAEIGNDTILRYYSISDKPETAIIKLNQAFSSCELITLNEEKLEDIAIRNHQIKVTFKPKEIITLKLKGSL